jgi:hypothetical protein
VSRFVADDLSSGNLPIDLCIPTTKRTMQRLRQFGSRHLLAIATASIGLLLSIAAFSSEWCGSRVGLAVLPGTFAFTLTVNAMAGRGGAANVENTAFVITNPSDLLREYTSESWNGMLLRALHNAANAPVSIKVCCDSFSILDRSNTGTGPVTSTNRYAEQLRIALQNQYGSHGTGIVPIAVGFNSTHPSTINAEEWAISGTYDTATTALGPTQNGQSGVYHLANGTVATFANPRRIKWDTLYVYCMTTSGSGSILVAIDSRYTATACGTATSSPTAHVVTLQTGVAAATHTVTFTSTGNSYLYAAQGTDGTKGVEVSVIAMASAMASAFGANPAQELAFSDIDPTGTQAVIIMDQTNDIGNAVPLTTFSANMAGIIAHEQHLSGAPSLLLAVPPPNIGVSGKNGPYTAAQIVLARTFHTGLVNIQDRAHWGTTNYIPSSLWSISGDLYPDVHPSDQGNLNEFAIIDNKLLSATGKEAGVPSIMLGLATAVAALVNTGLYALLGLILDKVRQRRVA